MKLWTFVVRRILLMVPVLLGVTTITFGLAWRANEGAMYRGYLSDKMSAAARDQLIRQYGFDQPWYIQYFSYLNRLLHGDFGLSHSQQDRAVTEVFKAFFPATAELSLVALTFAIIVGITLGVISAVKKDRPVDHFTRFMALAGVALPIFWLGLLLKFTFGTPYLQEIFATASPAARFVVAAVALCGGASLALLVIDAFGANVRQWHWRAVLGGTAALAVLFTFTHPLLASQVFDRLPDMPLGGRFSNELLIEDGAHPSLTDGPTNFLLIDTALARDWVAFRDVLRHLALPGVTLGYASMAIITRMMRSSMLETLSQDYVRTARAKGLPESVVLRRHARRNALVPTTTVIGLAFGGLLGGAVITETIFQWPGLGRWSTEAIRTSDTNSVLSFTLIVTFIYVAVNFIVDLAYAYLDPRIRLGGN